MKKEKMKTKELILAGAFVALYIVVLSILATVLGFVPVLYLILPFVASIALAPIFSLYVTKVPKFGAIIALGVAVVLAANMAAGITAIVWGLVITLIAEFIARSGQYQSKKKYFIAYIVFALTNIGPFFALLFVKDKFLKNLIIFYGEEYAAKFDALTPSWIVFAFMGSALVGGVIGGIFAKKVMKKHFEKAGIV